MLIGWVRSFVLVHGGVGTQDGREGEEGEAQYLGESFVDVLHL